MKYGRDAWIAAGLFAVALGVRALILALFPFDGLYGQDAYAYFGYAEAARAGLMHGQPLPAFFWPSGYPLHVVALSAIVGMKPIAAQSVSVIAGALIAPLTFALTREALLPIDPRRARRAGMVAGLMVALAAQLMVSSLSIMSDATGLAWATASAWLTLRHARTLRASTLALAAFTLSIAVITRWVFAWLAFPWTACVLLAWWHNRSSIGLRRAIALALVAVAVGGLIVGAQLSSGGSHTGDLQVVGWDPANALRNKVINVDGAFEYPLPIGLYYARPLLDPDFLFPLLAPVWLIGLWSLGRAPVSARALLMGWPLVIYAFLAGIAWQNPRFSLALFPPLAMWVGIGFDEVWCNRSTWRHGLLGLVVVAWIGMLMWSVREMSVFVERKNLDLARARHVAAQLPRGARVITFGLTLTLQRYTGLDAVEIYAETPDTLKDQVCRDSVAYVYLDVGNVEQQWAGLVPAVNYQWLRDTPGLRRVDQFEGYTLFKVGTCK